MMQGTPRDAFTVVPRKNEKYLPSFDALGNPAEEPIGVLLGSPLPP